MGFVGSGFDFAVNKVCEVRKQLAEAAFL